MRPFEFTRAADSRAALAPFAERGSAAHTQFLAGGTTLLDLMKLDVMRPEHVVDISALHESTGQVSFGPQGLRLGALVRMSEAADNPDIRRDYPVLAQSLQLAASAQIRNMATLGGNVLQRTRCTYFRDTSYPNCNKRNPGSGCAALGGVTRQQAVLGTSSHCIATYPGDFAQALLALDATVEISATNGATRQLPFSKLHRPPSSTPHIETTLTPGELIVAFHIPASVLARRSVYLKIRDRESYEFALASAAVALDLEGHTVKDSRVALGGVATLPWRSVEAEAKLNGQPLSDDAIAAAADAAFGGAKPQGENAFKIDLGKRTVARAIRQAAALES
jgi:xanthine dehydrogenase YagS FAD-binding subunit